MKKAQQSRGPTPLLRPAERARVYIDEQPVRLKGRPFWILRRGLVLGLHLLLLRILGRLDAEHAGRAIYEFCRISGVLWIKVGQLISMRGDLFPPALCAQLAHCQENADGIPTAMARAAVEEELGRPLMEVFSSFGHEPIAAASVSQVHRARLKVENRDVAVKIRRPHIEAVVAADLRLIRRLFNSFERFGIFAFMRWRDMLWELEQIFFEEIDLRYELSNQQRLGKSLRRHGLKVPRPYTRYCTAGLLVMEFIDGVSMADINAIHATDPERLKTWFKANRIDPEVVGRTLFHSYLRQLLEDNLFHADMHPGNLFLLADGDIVFLDFGSLGFSEGDMLRKYSLYLEATGSGQFTKAADLFLMFATELPAGDLGTLREKLLRCILAWDSRCRVHELPYSVKSASNLAHEMLMLLRTHRISINWTMFKIVRGWATLDTSLQTLTPRADLPRMMESYSRTRYRREMMSVTRNLPGDLLKLQKLIDYPGESSEMAIYRGATVRRLAQVFEGATDRVSRLVAFAADLTALMCTLIIIWQTWSLCSLQRLWTVSAPPQPHAMATFLLDNPQLHILALGALCYGVWSLTRLSRRFSSSQ
jgi:ubiquinone biosynthesis protein